MQQIIKLRDEDGDIYTFQNTEELLDFFRDVLKYEYQYMGEWI